MSTKIFIETNFFGQKKHIDYDMMKLNTELVEELKSFTKKNAKTILELGGLRRKRKIKRPSPLDAIHQLT